ncbi:hypothetical protein [Zhongshania sp.]|uniref:hypothetical protein n=1 Tax=Zhongshania sp. TaxID=1971902 RepID=UPI001B41E474|nr:hypothetical protein [Zhongshania sp.]MBQ0797093.1 hypothetical protein [Zhongshania sp.]
MKRLSIIALAFAFIPVVNAGFSLSGQAEIKEEAYSAQLATIRQKALTGIKASGEMPVYQGELSIAPLVVAIDFQKTIKVAQGVSVLGEYTPWLNLEQSIWGFEEAIDSADEKITARIEELMEGDIWAMDESTKSESSKLIYFPVKMPDLNRKMPNQGKTLVAFDSFGFSVDDLLKATNIELIDEDELDGVVFFPYINLALHKQTATTSVMNGELMINYVAAINGYFAICKKMICFKAELPNNSYIDLVVPLVHRKEATSDETHVAAREYGQELMADMITELTLAAFEKLTDIVIDEDEE